MVNMFELAFNLKNIDIKVEDLEYLTKYNDFSRLTNLENVNITANNVKNLDLLKKDFLIEKFPSNNTHIKTNDMEVELTNIKDNKTKEVSLTL